MIALWLYVRKTKLSVWMVLDNIAIATGTTACFIRLAIHIAFDIALLAIAEIAVARLSIINNCFSSLC